MENLADKINDTLLINRYESGLDYYKLIPTEKENDRQVFINLVKGEMNDFDGQLKRAYQFFEREVKKSNIDVQRILTAITQKLSWVSIVLHEQYDNPHLVFEKSKLLQALGYYLLI